MPAQKYVSYLFPAWLSTRIENTLLTLDEFCNLFLQSTNEKHFLYDIVANGRNGIDVDK